ncbi:MAG: MFS transporter [Anaerolineae bacterium]
MSSQIAAVDLARRRWAMVALYAAAVVVFGDMYLTQPILPILSQEFGIAPATAGLSVSAVVLLIAFASLSYGSLSDSLGRKPVMVWSTALLTLPTLLCALAPTFGVLLIFRALQGLFIPGLTAVAVAYLGDLVDHRALGAAVGGWIAANVAGGLVGRVGSGLITDVYGWRAAFAVFAGLTLLAAIGMALALPRDGRHAHGDWRAAYRGMFALLRYRRLVGAFIIGGALFFGFLGFFTYLPYYLTGAPFYLSPGIVSLAYLSYLAGVIVSPIAGRLSARVSRRRLIAVGLGIAMLGITLTLIPVLPVIIVCLFVLCSGMFTAQAVTPAFVNIVAPHSKGGAGALYLVFYYVGGTLGGVVPGLAWQSVGWSGVTSVCLSAFVVALLADWLLCRE